MNVLRIASAAVMLGLLPVGTILAQEALPAQAPPRSPLVTVSVSRQPLLNALETLFRNPKPNRIYKVERVPPLAMQTLVSVRARGETLDQVLLLILEQVKVPRLTYHIERGVYYIYPAPKPPEPVPPAEAHNGGIKPGAEGELKPDPSAPVRPAAVRSNRPELLVETGHQQRITGLSFSADGQYLASGGGEGSVLLWSVASAKLFRSLKGRLGPGGFRADGQAVATVDDRTVTLWNPQTGRADRTFRPHNDRIQSASFSSDGKFLVTSSPDQYVRVLDARDGKLLHAFRAPSLRFLPGDATSVPLDRLARLPRNAARTDPWYDAVISPDGRYVAARVIPGPPDDLKNPLALAVYTGVTLWDAETGKTRLLPMPETPGGVAFSRDSLSLAVVTRGYSVTVWDVKAGKARRELARRRDPVTGSENLGISFSPDGRTLACAGPRRSLEFWDVSGVLLESRPAHTQWDIWSVSAIAYSQDGGVVAVGSDASEDHKDKITLWDAVRRRPLYNLGSGALSVNTVAFGAEGQLIAASSGLIRVWDTGMRRSPQVVQGDAPLVVGPKGTWFACRRNPRTVQIRDTTSLKLIRTFEAGTSEFLAQIAVSPDGEFLATVNTGESVVRLWDVGTGALIRTIDRCKAMPRKVVFGGKGDWVAIVGGRDDNAIRLFHVNSGDWRKTWEQAGEFAETAVTASPRSGLMAVQVDGVQQMVDLNGDLPKDLGPLRGLDGKPAMGADACFSRNGDSLITQSNGGELTRWDLRTGVASARTAKDHYLPVISPSDRHLLSRAGDQESLKLRDLLTNKERLLTGSAGRMNSYAFSPDGRTIATSGEDAVVRLWDTYSGTLRLVMVGLGRDVKSVDYVAALPTGYYMASKGALLSVAFRLGETVYPFDQFDLQLNRPDLVLQGLFLAKAEQVAIYQTAHARRLARMAVKTPIPGTDNRPFQIPEIAIVDGELPKSTDRREVRFTVHVSDPNHPLSRILVYVNDVPVFGSAGVDISKAKLRGDEQEIRLVLAAPRNKIQVSAVNDQGFESRRLTHEVHFTGELPKPDLYVLAVGVSKYQDPKLKLDYAAKDAKDIAEYFSSLGEEVRKMDPAGLVPVAGGVASGMPAPATAPVTAPMSVPASAAKVRIAVPGPSSNRGKPLPAQARRKPGKTPAKRPASASRKSAPRMARKPAVPTPVGPRKFRVVHVLPLLDQNATATAILAARARFLEAAREEDQVVVYLAGHGVCGEGFQYYFLPTEGSVSAPESTGIPYEKLEGLLDGIRARQKLLLLDSCQSGESDFIASAAAVPPADAVPTATSAAPDQAPPASNQLKRGSAGKPKATGPTGRLVRTRGFKGFTPRAVAPPEVMAARQVLEDVFADLRRGSGALVVAAAGSEEYALEGGDLQNGTFTYALLHGLKSGEADADSNKVITVSELRDYVSEMVQKLTTNRQRPTARSESIEFDWAIK